ncbi:MAG: carbon storage regulator [Bryobacteraceae bacterium]
MLVIRRKPGESIVIGDEIEVTVTEITSTRVKLCIAAPKEISVLRKEVQLTRDANRAAAGAIGYFPGSLLGNVSDRLLANARAPVSVTESVSALRNHGRKGVGETFLRNHDRKGVDESVLQPTPKIPARFDKKILKTPRAAPI